MKKPVIVLLLLGAGVALAQADLPPRAEPISLAFEWPSWFSNNNTGNLQGQVNHLNRMLGHVRWEFTRYHSNRAVQQDYWRVKHEADRLNAHYKTGKYDQKQMRNDVHGLHVRLQEIEVRLKVKKADLYQWR